MGWDGDRGWQASASGLEPLHEIMGTILLGWAEPHVHKLPHISGQGCCVSNAAWGGIYLSADNLFLKPMVSLDARRGQLGSGREQKGSVSHHPTALPQFEATLGSPLVMPPLGCCQVHSPGWHAVHATVGRAGPSVWCPRGPILILPPFLWHRTLVWMSPLSTPWWEPTARLPSSSSLSTAAM